MKFNKMNIFIIILLCTLFDLIIFYVTGRQLFFAQYASFILLLWRHAPVWAPVLSAALMLVFAPLFGTSASIELLLIVALAITVILGKRILADSSAIITGFTYALLIFSMALKAPLLSYPIWAWLGVVGIVYVLNRFYGTLKLTA